MRSLVILFFLFTSVTIRADQIDRRQLVERAHLLLKPSLTYLIASYNEKSPLGPHLTALIHLQKVVDSGFVKLAFVPSLNEFEFKDAPSNRFMGTGFDPYSPIYVSTSIMNRPEFSRPGLKPLAFVFMILVHEYFNKVEGLDQAEKDVIAAKIAAELANFELQMEDGDLEFTLFSLPKDNIYHELSMTGEDDVQPSFAALINQSGRILDATDAINLTTHRVTPALRTGWTEANRLMFMIMPVIMKMARECQKKVHAQMCQMTKGFEDIVKMDEIHGFNEKMAEMVESFKYYSAGELRILELFDVKSAPVGKDDHVISLRARFSLDRSGLDLLRDFHASLGPGWSVTNSGGLEEKSILEIPLVFKFYLKSGQLSDFSADLRPNLKFDVLAKVGRISRLSGQIATMTVRLPTTKLPQIAHLNLNNRQGSYSLEAIRIEPHSTNTVELEFRIPDSVDQSPSELWADSIMIDQTSAYMLDRLIEIRPQPQASGQDQAGIAEPAKILDARLEMKDFLGKTAWSEDFHPLFPVVLLNPEWLQFFNKYGQIEGQDNSHWVDVNQINFRFSLSGKVPIKEIRLQINEEIAVGKPDEADGDSAYSGEIKVHGKTVPVWSTVSVREKAHLQRVLVIPGETLRSHKGIEGEVIYEGTGRAVISLLDIALQPGEGYGPTMIRPVKLEVVLEDLTTLSHEFPTKPIPADLCNEILSSGAEIKTSVHPGK